MKRNRRSVMIVVLPLIVFVLLLLDYTGWLHRDFKPPNLDLHRFIEKRLEVEKVVLETDQDGDGIYDLDDIVQGARKDMAARPRYRDAYYAGGYPPDNEGVCTDVIWRALMNAGYNLKEMIDRDIREHPGDYPRVGGVPEPNIDFRRVPNQEAFFRKYAEQLTTQIIPWDAENLKQWQGGDIVVFGPPYEHVGVVSDRRRADGVPLLIHNAGPYTREDNGLLTWPSPIKYHFRFPKVNAG